ncbi:crotonase/enoyl-CoA hydratase family protein [Actinoplanes sp. NPDC049668]|uniref:type II toxin-antitoxin system Rv0910 family toxin n=1 Tax=unclassified Actinoplanes TaxID=2626549 RepID=UPI0033ACD94E
MRPYARLRAGLAVGRAMAATTLSRLIRRPAPPVVLTAVEQPRVFAYPYVAAAEIAADPDRIFAVLADPARMGDWLVLHAGWPAQPPAGLVPGERMTQRVKLMGVPSDVRWTVTGIAPPRTVWLDGTGPMGITVGFYLSVAPAAGGALVRCDGGVEGGTADGPLGSMLARNLAEAMQKSLEKLATAVGEQAPPVPRPAARATPGRPPRTRGAPIRHERSGRDLDPWTPVIVGVGQVSDRSTEPRGADPVSLAVRALRLAARDAGAGDELLAAADSVGYVASVSWQYPDGAALIAEALDARPAETVQTGLLGGDGSLRLLNDAAAAIAAGHVSVALLGGAEAAATAAAAERAGRDLAWPGQREGTAPARTIGVDTVPNNDAETAAGLVAPIHLYALIESAIRGRLGLSRDEHRARITELWSRFCDVAATNPYAWLPGRRTAAELGAPGGANRPIAAPYPKLLTAHLQVNQATGIIVCSAEAAQRAGIAQDRWVFAHAGAHATDEWYVTERADLASSPAIAAAGRAVLGHTGLSIDDVRHVDLYACFPSAVQIAAAELGLPIDDPARPLTVTGGLTFAGGPGNNYAGHAVANLVPLLRADPDGYGLATAVGWYLTKHAIGVFSARPPERGYRDIDADLRLPRPAARKTGPAGTGTAVLEAYTVPYGRDGEPEAGIVTALTPDGARVVRRTRDRALIERLLAEDPLGWRIDVTGDGFTVADTTPAPLPPAGEPPVQVEWQGPVTVIRLNRPAVRNAVDLATARALERAVDAFEADPDARVAVLTGGDTVFCAGMDLKAAARGEYPVTEGRGLLGLTARPPRKPLIAAVEGAAVAGGCELALAADLIVAGEDAAFGIPEVQRGLVAAAGGVLRFARSLPRATALELALTGEPMPARRLHELGLVNRVTAPGKALETALELAHHIAANAPLAVLLSKRIVDEHGDWSTAEAFDRLSGIAGEVIASVDAAEGVRAYAEKRAPVWTGR